MKNLKKFKDFLFESSDVLEMPLDDETRDIYTKTLEKLVSLPDLYNKYGTEAWVSVADDLPYSDFMEIYDDNDISQKDYSSYRRKYKKFIKENPNQAKIDEFIISLSGVYDDELFHTQSKKPIEWWINELAGFPMHVPYMAKSLWDGINLVPIKFKKIK